MNIIKIQSVIDSQARIGSKVTHYAYCSCGWEGARFNGIIDTPTDDRASAYARHNGYQHKHITGKCFPAWR